jgi:phage recombination protein Bet
MPPQADTDTMARPETPTGTGPTISRALALREPDMKWLDIPRDELVPTLQASLFPGAKPASVAAVLDYCEAARLNVMLKPVHIVPMSVKLPTGKYEYRDVVMPGINHYRTQASRSGVYAGKSEPEFGEDVTETLSGTAVTFPAWCKVTVYKIVAGMRVAFTATEFWIENYATAGKDTKAPNKMWRQRPRGQIAKCAEAQALRMAFPELVGGETAEEMEGKVIDLEAADVTPRPAASKSLDGFAGDGPKPNEPEDAVVEEIEPEPEEKDTRSDVAPDMPPKIAQPFYKPDDGKEPDWQPGWKWLNEVMPGLTQPARQDVAVAHAKLLWAVYDSDATAKKGGGPQSKAAQKFCEDQRVILPSKEAIHD